MQVKQITANRKVYQASPEQRLPPSYVVRRCFLGFSLGLCVRDDAKGVDPSFLTEPGRAGHYGLQGMRERAKLMGGRLTVWSEFESGTEIELSILASRAYAAMPSPRRSGFAVT